MTTETFDYIVGQHVWVVSTDANTVLPCKVLQVTITITATVHTVEYILLNGCKTITVLEENVYDDIVPALTALGEVMI